MAASLTLNQRLSALRGQIPDEGPVPWIDLAPVLRDLAEAFQIEVTVDDFDLEELDDGFHLRPRL